MVVLAAAVGLSLLLVVYFVKRVPHGFVPFKSGLLLKFTPGLDDKPIPVLRKALEIAITGRKVPKRFPIFDVRDFEIQTRHGEVTLRYYHHSTKQQESAIFYIHGGGWSVCSTNTHDEPCRHLAKKVGIPVISINYSLSPESKFPQALEECCDCLEHLSSENRPDWLNPSQFIVCGDSAGGNLSIGVADYFLAKLKVSPVRAVILIYPTTDLRPQRQPSYYRYSEGYYLTHKVMTLFASSYLTPGTKLDDPRLSPLAKDDWSGFPPTLIITAEFDPLRDEGEAFGKLLWNSGCDVQIVRYASAIHGFFGFSDFGSSGIKAIRDVAKFINNLPPAST